MKFLLGVHGALKAVVEELACDRSPDGVGGGVGAIDIVPDLLGDGGVEPRDDAGINLEPLGVVDHGSGIHRAVDVVEEAEFFEGHLEEGTPLPEVALVGGESDGDMATDVQHHEGRGRGWRRISEGVGAGG